MGIKDGSNNYDVVPTWFQPGQAWLHTNFTLKSSGEKVFLVDNTITAIDSVDYPSMKSDDSYGRFPDGSAVLKYFEIPTPASTNNGSATYSGYVTPPTFSVDGGFYTSVQTLSLADTFPGAIIRYTTDGAAPTVASPQYSASLLIDSNKVLRARGFALGYLPSSTASNTYFISDNSTLPVISISTAPDNLFDWNTGIYTLGPNAEVNVPFYGANYWQDWEIPIHMEFFNVNKSLEFEQDLGMKINGGWSRTAPQKSFRILARGRYGDKTLDYQLFPDKDIFSFRRFVLRTSGNESAENGTMFRDALMHKLVDDTYNDYQDHRPSIVYLNGAFWGIYNIREKIGRYYLQENYGVDPDSVDLLQFDGAVVEGSNVDFLDMVSNIVNLDMAVTNNYQAIEARLDIQNFCDHFITQTFYVNWDWPQNNIKYWRSQKPGSKWRYIVTDMDMGLGFIGSVNDDDLERLLTQSTTVHAQMVNGLLDNTTFHNYFINRYADLINTVFTADNMRGLAYLYRDSIIGEMQRHIDLWGGDFSLWQTVNIEGNLINFINNRQAPARNHIEQFFNLNKQVNVTLNVYPEGAGTIQISTIVPDSLPWTGVYFDGVPVTITAIPNPGYQFSFWQSIDLLPSPNSNISISLNIDTNDAFTAYFFGTADTPRVTISEINYKSELNFDVGDWIELHNYGTLDMDLTGWVFKDSNDANIYAIPDSTTLTAGGYLVIASSMLKFSTAYPGVTNYIGPFNFGLSSISEGIRLFDQNGDLYLSMSYGGASPWPVLANGGGHTLELLDPNNNLSSSSNWFDGCYAGSPGAAFTPCVVGLEDDDVAGELLSVEQYPNPFDRHTNIFITTSEKSRVVVTLIDMLGNEVALLHNNELVAGRHYIGFYPENLSPGLYYLHVQTSGARVTKVLSYLGSD
ncbi:MAG: CotH kinase family protein [Flavobacteriales bacterium]|nr:CotH kinase family protein [Flavobacteriales bacterium]